MLPGGGPRCFAVVTFGSIGCVHSLFWVAGSLRQSDYDLVCTPIDAPFSKTRFELYYGKSIKVIEDPKV